MALYRLGMDLGNMWLKAVIEEIATGKITKCKIENRISTTPDIDTNARKLQRDGKTLFVGGGELQNNVLKHERNHIMDQILVMAHELTKDKDYISIELAVGLPPKQYNNAEFRKTFLSKIEVNTPIEYRVNDKFKKIIIEKVSVYYEGYSAFYNIIDSEGIQDNVLVLDCGGGTIDACSYRKNIDTDVHDAIRTHTIETGSINILEELRQHINEKLKGNIALQTIDNTIRANKETFRHAGKDHNINDYLPVIENSIDSVMNNLSNEYKGLDQFQIALVGGGAKLLNKYAHKHISDNFELDDEKRFYANAEGYLEQLQAE